MKQLLIFLSIILTINSNIYACSSIVIKNDSVNFLAKNFDWTYGEGIIIKNLKGSKKLAYFTHTGEPLEWTSKYGSITFNQNGKEMPYGGMNEKGLVIEMLWLETTQYNLQEDKKYVNELEWIQYQLDQFQTVQEVIDHLNNLKIYPLKGKIHYILSDHKGESVIIEYLNGKPYYYKKEANFCQTITNNSVLQSEPYKINVKKIRKKNTYSLFRYHQLEQKISTLEKQKLVDEKYAFEILEKVTISKGDFRTRWSIVYNIQQRIIFFFTDTHKEIKTIDLKEIDFENKLSYFEMNQNEKTNLHKELKELSESINFSYLSPSLIHLELDEKFTKEISQHHFSNSKSTTSIFNENYFHFEITIPLENERQTGFLAIMNSEDNFKNRKAVTGGYLYGNIAKGLMKVHIYGLKNGKYSLISFIDENQNRKLDFKKDNSPIEKYATFKNIEFKNESELNFENTAVEFNRSNSIQTLKWKNP